MKQYLNRSEKNQVLTLSGFIDYATNTANEWAKLARNKESVKALRMAKSFIFRSLCIKCEQLDDDERDTIMNQSKKMDVVLKYSNEAIREYKYMMELDSVTPIKTSDLLDLCEIAMESCSNCSGSSDICKIKKLFIKYEVPVCNDTPSVGECPYFDKGDDYEKAM